MLTFTFISTRIFNPLAIPIMSKNTSSYFLPLIMFFQVQVCIPAR